MKISYRLLVIFLLSSSYLYLSLAQGSERIPPTENISLARSNTLLGKNSDQRFTHKPTPSSVNDTGFTTLGRWAWGDCYGIALTGHYAIVGQGLDYQVVDISDLSHPYIIYDSVMAGEGVEEIKIIDTLLFVLLNDKVLICDGRQLFPLHEYGEYDVSPGSSITLDDVAVTDSLLYLTATSGAGVIAVNIADITHPYFLEYFSVGENEPSAIASQGNVFYYGAGGARTPYLYVLQYVSDSLFFREKDVYIYESATAICLHDSLLYVGSGNGKLYVFNCTDPWLPQTPDTVEVQSTVYKIACKGNNIYCSTSSGVVVLNAIDPYHPTVVAHGQQKLHAFKLAVSDSVLAIAEDIGVEFYSIVPSDSIKDVSYFPAGGENYSLAKQGNIIFLASSVAGLWSVDFTDTKHPQAISNIQTFPADAIDVTLTGSVACVLIPRSPGVYSGKDSVLLVGFDPAGHLTRLSSFPVSDNPTSIAAKGSVVIVGADSAVGIYSVGDPVHPSLLGTITIAGESKVVSVQGNILAVTTRVFTAGLSLYDITNPQNPKQLSYLPMDAVGVLLEDSLAFVGGPNFDIFNISNPASPSAVALTNISCGSSTKFARSGNFIYKTGDYVGIVDISNLNQPQEVTSFLYYSFPYGIAVSRDTVFVATSSEGVWVLKNNIPTSVNEREPAFPASFVLMDNYPNPFNPSTKISYEVPKRTFVRLQIFNILGQLIETVVDEEKQPGAFNVSWNAGNVPSGVYFYRINAGSFVDTKKMVVIR